MTTPTLSRRKRLLFTALTACLVLAVTFVLGEILIRLVSPRESLYPRWTFSRTYGLVLDRNAAMVHSRPGQWQFVYTTNEYGCRGRLVPLSNSYDTATIVALGDSYTFGEGVDDSCVFTEHLADGLKGMYNVVNLGTPGWGLTQEIRRFYEFGILYAPRIVILQFCRNDPKDNLESLVTVIRGGRFQFRDVDQNEFLGIKKYLSHSLIQKSQIYNLIREVQFRSQDDIIESNVKNQLGSPSGTNQAAERFYCDLLDLFSRDLARRGIVLIMIAVHGQLRQYPEIRGKVEALDSSGLLRYVDVARWVPNPVPSPQGHLWGNEAHTIIGDSLAGYIRMAFPGTDTHPPAGVPPVEHGVMPTTSQFH